MRRPSIAFFTFNEWAYGTIHKALIKELYVHGVQADIVDWSRTYSSDEMAALNDVYDVFMTQTCDGLKVLRNYGIPDEKIIAVAHGRPDLQKGVEVGNDYSNLMGYAGVSNDLANYSKKLGIEREMTILQCGVSFDYFYRRPSEGLRTVGYAGKFHRPDEFDNIPDLKRGILVQTICEQTGTGLRISPSMTHLAMPAFYKDIDAVMVSSVYESCSLPLLEAAAAGRLPISSPVGITLDLNNTPGYTLPSDADGYISSGVVLLKHLKSDPALFQSKCLEAQEYAREYYDWSKVITPWLKLIVGKL